MVRLASPHNEQGKHHVRTQDYTAAITPFDPVVFGKTFTHKTAAVSGARIHYFIGGAGPALLLLHGWPASWYEYRKVMPLLADRFTVIAADLPGMGDSGPAPAYDKHSIARVLLEMMKGLGIERFHLAGHDVGGPVAFAMAGAAPDRITRLSLLEMMLAGEEQDTMQTIAFPNLWHIAFNAAPGSSKASARAANIFTSSIASGPGSIIPPP